MGGSPKKIECPACNKEYPWHEKYAGKKVLCSCGTKLRMPFSPGGTAEVVGVSPTQALQPKTDPPPPIRKPAAPAPAAPRKAPPPGADDNIDLMDAAAPKASKPPSSQPSAFSPTPNEPAEEEGEYGLNFDNAPAAPRRKFEPVESPARQPVGGSSATSPTRFSEPEPPPGQGVECPSCEKRYKAGSKICVVCGIDVDTGRSIIVSNVGDLNQVYINAQTIVQIISWIIPLGLYPFATEAHGGRKKYAIWGIALGTIIVSVWFYCLQVSNSSQMRTYKNLLLWTGKAPVATEILQQYEVDDKGSMGDGRAFYAALSETEKAEQLALATTRPTSKPKPKPAASDDEGETGTEATDGEAEVNAHADKAVLDAYNSLTPEQKVYGEYHPYQLVTNTFLHAGFMHMAGNLLFLLVFGLAINGLIGNVGTLALYFTLGICASVAHYVDVAHDPPAYALGASGAIMGLAGMYLIFFPIHKVHTAAWLRRGLFRGFALHMNLFDCKGFWILLFYIAFDVFWVLVGVRTGTAHWAHLGGFLCGMGIALALLVTRAINPRGGDLLSVIFGKHAWPLIGKPSQWVGRGTEEGWLQRIHLPARASRGE
jgi:membrane associated rhomboid family serine protease